MGNPFNDELDWALRGKLVRVHTSHRVYDGWVERVHHQRGSIILHDCEVMNRLEDHKLSDPKRRGSVFIRNPEEVEVKRPRKEIIFPNLELIMDSPYIDHDFEVADDHMQSAYRNRFTGSFPVVRELEPDHPRYDTNDRYELINGHKRIAAAREAGLLRHPCESIRVDDETAKELVALAHSETEVSEPSADGESIPRGVEDASNEEDD